MGTQTNEKSLAAQADRDFEEALSSFGDLWAKTDWYPPNPDDIIKKHGKLGIYDTVMTDASVRSAMRGKINAVATQEWEIAPASDEDGDLKVAQFTTYVFDKMFGSVQGTMTDILDACVKGFSVVEKILVDFTSGPFAGMVGYKELAAKDPSDFQFRLDEYGKPVELLNWLTTRSRPIVLTREKYIIYSYAAKYRLPWGESDLRAVYKHWWSKDFLTKAENIFLETLGMPTRVVKIPNSVFYNKERRDKLYEVIKSTMLSTVIRIPDDVSVEFMKAIEGGRTAFREAIDGHKEEISKAILGASLTSEVSKFGSGGLAVSKTHETTKTEFVGALSNDIQEIFNEQIIRPICDLNFPPSLLSAYPKFRFVDSKDRIPILNATDVKTLFDAGVLVLETDINAVRVRLGFSKIDEQTIQRMREAVEAKKAQAEALRASLGQTNAAGDAPNPEDSKTDKSDGNGKKPEEPAQKFARGKGPFWRPLTPAEERADMHARYADMQRGEQEIMNAVSPLFLKARDTLAAWLSKNVFVNGKADLGKLDEVRLMHMDKVRAVLAEKFLGMFRKAIEQGEKLSKIPEKERSDYASVWLSAEAQPPLMEMAMLKRWQVSGDWRKIRDWRTRRVAAAGKLIENDAFWITSVTNDTICNQVKNIIHSGLKNARNQTEMMKQIGGVFEKYIARENAPAVLATAPRLEAIVRTNVTRIFATAHVLDLQDPLTQEAFPGGMYTAVMDADVCEECAALDGKIFPNFDPVWGQITPPLHFKCRCDIVPVPADEIPGFDSANDARQVLENILPEFGGSKGT